MQIEKVMMKKINRQNKTNYKLITLWPKPNCYTEEAVVCQPFYQKTSH